ncbi:MAG TPA: hypothetical protein IAA20_07845 [Candidatus Enterococcus avicola]|uniref:Uncharacterized protein n=1 Tax=Candidatus Enterococcus avicola TaxID=2838561 RepID=A0A9D2F8Q2_9ENTE|nr:hypothetical protein [Lactobacillus sp.]HIZ53836.1 hypothetical protein [Candidatus Enterococcus avicola]
MNNNIEYVINGKETFGKMVYLGASDWTDKDGNIKGVRINVGLSEKFMTIVVKIENKSKSSLDAVEKGTTIDFKDLKGTIYNFNGNVGMSLKATDMVK